MGVVLHDPEGYEFCVLRALTAEEQAAKALAKAFDALGNTQHGASRV